MYLLAGDLHFDLDVIGKKWMKVTGDISLSNLPTQMSVSERERERGREGDSFARVFEYNGVRKLLGWFREYVPIENVRDILWKKE